MFSEVLSGLPVGPKIERFHWQSPGSGVRMENVPHSLGSPGNWLSNNSSSSTMRLSAECYCYFQRYECGVPSPLFLLPAVTRRCSGRISEPVRTLLPIEDVERVTKTMTRYATHEQIHPFTHRSNPVLNR